jgi:hypothetical protein
MPIKFISLHEEFIYLIQKTTEYEGHCIQIHYYIPDKKTYYVCTSNTLCFFTNEYEQIISTHLFPQLEKKVKNRINMIGKKNKIGSYYLPIGSSLIQSHDTDENKKVIISPIMLLPQNVSQTKNAYFATMAILYNILIIQKEKIDQVDILFTSLCCDDHGNMNIHTSLDQILQGINDYYHYITVSMANHYTIYNDSLLMEIELDNQPKYFHNTEWFHIPIQDIISFPSKKKSSHASSFIICTISFFLFGYVNKKYKEQEFCFININLIPAVVNTEMDIKYYIIHNNKRIIVS